METQMGNIVITDRFCQMDACSQLSLFHIVYRGHFCGEVCVDVRTIIASLGFGWKDVVGELLDNGYLSETENGYQVILG